jgi:hypothetical protein
MRRRRFVKLMAASAALVLTQPVEHSLAAAAAKRPVPPAPEPAVAAATRQEMASQKKSVADMLKVIRAYKLPPGSRPASVFRAEKRSVSRA